MVAGNSTPRMGKSGRGGKRGAKMSYGGAEDEELAELQKRFHALEEEARVTAERAQSLPGSTTATPRLHVRVARERDSTSAVRAENEAELAKLDGDIASLRRRHDELAHANMEKRRELERLTDRLSDLTKESKLPSADDSPIMKEIRVLEARLQKAVVKYEDAQEVRRTYEQIVKRLKEERIGFANQLEVREATMGGKESDYEELLLMSHDAVKVDAPPPVAVGDASLVPVLQRCEAQLRVVLEAIRQEEEALVRDLGEAALQKTADVPAEPPVVNNNRVKEGMGGEEEAASEEEFEEDLEEEVVEREALKKQSGTILDRATKGRKKKRGGKKEAS